MTIPKQYDISWINVEPHRGYEEGGHNKRKHNDFRPFVVCSNNYYNGSRLVVGFTVHYSRWFPKSVLIPISTTKKKIHGFIIPFLYGYDYIARSGEIVDHLDHSSIRKVKMVIHDIFNN